MISSRLSTALFCLLVVLVTGSGCTQIRGTAMRSNPISKNQREVRMDFAKAHEREGNLPKAEEVLRSVLKADPKDAEAKHRLGVILVRRGESEDGIKLLEEAAESLPKSLAVRNDLGYAYLVKGDPEKAEQEFREALNLSPKHSQSLNNLGLALGYQGRHEEAYTVFRQTMTEAEALANLGFIHSQRGEVDLALQRYSQALSHDPTLRNAAEGMIQVSTLRTRVIAARQQSGDGTLQAERQETPSPNKQGIQLSNFSTQSAD